MNRKTLLSIALLSFLSFVTVLQNASAAVLDTYTVDSSSSTVAKNTFNLSETPFLYMKLSLSDIAPTQSFWNAPSSTPYFEMTGPNLTLERWHSLTDWSTRKEAGEWTINSNVFYTGGTTGTSVANFTVTPEPISMVLFLIGGAPMAVSLYRKRQKSAKIAI